MISQKKFIVGYPKLGNYYVPIYNLLKNLVDKKDVDILVPEKMTSSIIKKGGSNSPDFICTPFKYNMGNFIDALENGANVLIQAGGGCRYGYYYELQEKILKDLGYNFIFINLMDEDGINILNVYKKFKILNKRLLFKDFCYYFILGVKMLSILDKFESYMRLNYSLQINKNEFKNIQNNMLTEMKKVSSIKELNIIKKKYYNKIYNVKLRKEKKEDIKIGIVGELFTSMEPFASFNLESKLNDFDCIVKRYTTATYLLFEKGFEQKNVLKKSKKYIDFLLGADGAETVARTLELIENGYDGIIHIKPFGCIPEINAMPILQKISNDYNIPIMYLTFDEQTSTTGINTRIEAFYDMLKMKKENDEEILNDDKVLKFKKNRMITIE